MMLHVARTTPWDFCTALQRITDNVEPDILPDIYRSFNRIQRHWTVTRAYKRGGITRVNHNQTEHQLGLPCVSCPWPNKNIPHNWRDDPDSDLIYATFIAIDGNYRLSRNNKGGGEATDPSYFGDVAFYAPNERYKDFCRARGGADDEIADITCRGHKSGDATKFNHSPRKACLGVVCGVCARSAAFFHWGVVDLALGERFVNVDFALVHILQDLVKAGIKKIVVSYDVACKYNINFDRRINHSAWPLLTTRESRELKAVKLAWLVPKFHLAAHVEGCADKYSFNWTKNVGRTCGENVESNWSSLNGLATSVREMGFGSRRDAINDAMLHHNWWKGGRESQRILKAFMEAIEMRKEKHKILLGLEEALGDDVMEQLRTTSALSDGSQFRLKKIVQPTRASILKLLQQEEGGFGPEYGVISTRATRSVGINRALEVEMRQVQFKHQLRMGTATTDIQWNKMEDARRKLSQLVDGWFRNVGDFMPVNAINEVQTANAGPENAHLCLPSEFPQIEHNRLGIADHALIERELRIGQAYDALKKLRNQLGLKSFLVRRKRQNPGYTMATRAETEIKKVDGHVKKWRKVYESAWKALEVLRGDGIIPHEHHWLTDQAYWKDLGERQTAEATRKGEGPKQLPWIWKIELDIEETSLEGIEGAIEGWTNEAIRLEWLYARASYERWDEETKLLKAEGERVGKSFGWLKKQWQTRKMDWGRDDDIPRGAVAYAARTATTFARLEQKGLAHFLELLKVAVKYAQS
ncbi:hypothetical protein M422DRAFT_255248 [Sphaerobolus stellatus SS14]|uniref:Unplaced genomic scaffold SPHSTscaffold_60, whole genome shotgun sequence n=1 Tax=Sphaerobolus stellatus (strain SS14) TaxID=990650 RepID=A0A0C9VTY2_SPHS4|nr:hypothetical protein M422DRAFT_255248 [Sphaerobolus stellatus SS14]